MLSGHQRITWRRNIAENFNRLSRVHERYRQTTDRRQTTTYSEREHEFTFANIGVYMDLHKKNPDKIRISGFGVKNKPKIRICQSGTDYANTTPAPAPPF